jgi:hypothetical protein
MQAEAGAALTLQGSTDGEQVAVTVQKIVDPISTAGSTGPGNGNHYVAVEIGLANVGTIAYADAPAKEAILEDSLGGRYEAVAAQVDADSLRPISDLSRQFSTVELAPGETSVGLVIFEVPADSIPVVFEFGLDGGTAGETGRWTLD